MISTVLVIPRTARGLQAAYRPSTFCIIHQQSRAYALHLFVVISGWGKIAVVLRIQRKDVTPAHGWQGGSIKQNIPERDGSILMPAEENSLFCLSQKSYISSCFLKGTSPSEAFIVINWRERSSVTNEQENTFRGSKQLGQKYRHCRYEQGSGQEAKLVKSCTRWNTCYLHFHRKHNTFIKQEEAEAAGVKCTRCWKHQQKIH